MTPIRLPSWLKKHRVRMEVTWSALFRQKAQWVCMLRKYNCVTIVQGGRSMNAAIAKAINAWKR